MSQADEELSWSLEIPDGWLGEDLDECVVFSAEEGVGVLQVVAYYQDDVFILEDLEDLLDEQLPEDHELRFEKVNVGEFSGVTVSLREEEEYARYWAVSAERLALVITYHCNDEDRNVEAQIIEDMLETLILERD